MKSIKHLLAMLTIVAAITLLAAPNARAADYAVQKTFWSASSITNVAGQTTNLNAAIDLTQFSDFVLQVDLGFTNASAGTYDLAWSQSADGVKWGDVGQAKGHFSVPLTNGGPVISWTTNITVDALGYWRIEWGTNAAVQHLTNAQIRGFVKPKRTASDQ